jgi:putative tryptophan/tyrosine transport system substrate-binding protein
MERRAFLSGAAALLAAPPAAEAQQPGKVYRLGHLGVNRASDVQHLLEALRQGLKELGWIEGHNIQIDYRWAEGRSDRLGLLADELIQQQVDVLIAPTAQTIRAAQGATRSIPIVMVASNDPVSDGFVASLGRPGRNITGLIFDPGPQVAGKQVQLLVQAIPRLSRVAVMGNPANPTHPKMVEAVRTGARSSGLQMEFFEARTFDGVKNALDLMARVRPPALLVLPDGILFGRRQEIVEFGFKQHVPAIFPWREAAAIGGFMAYGANLADNFRRAASFVDRILRGARPADLPVELLIKFELVINLKTAKALGLTIPPSLLQRADQVIE